MKPLAAHPCARMAPHVLPRLAVAFAAFLLGLLAASCGGGGGGGDGGGAGAGGTVPPPDPSARATIGSAGGTVASPDGKLVLTIPAGALSNATEITITEVSAANVPERLRSLGADRVFKLEPEGLQFAQPVLAEVVLPGGRQLATMALDGGGATEYPTNQRLALGATERRLQGRVNHFSHVLTETLDGFTLTLAVAPASVLRGERR